MTYRGEPTNEITPLANSGFLYDSIRNEDLDESEVITYIQNRRASIASCGTDKIPSSLILSQGGGIRSHIDRGNDELITTSRSNASFVGDVLSHASGLLAEPETDYKTEIKVLFEYSIPLVITFLLQYSLTVASVFSVGRLGLRELAAVSLSSMTANISGYAIIQGVSTCLDTLCAQAYGRKEFSTVGVHFFKCNYLLFLLCIPMFLLWVFGSKPILLMIIGNEKEELCSLASQYLQVLSLGLPAFILFENGKHFLQAQGIFHASTYVLAICAPLNAYLNYLLVWNKSIGMGFVGAPISVSITNWLMCILLYLYIWQVKGNECWPSGGLLSPIFFRNWTRMINLSIPGVLMVEAEWLAFEIITFTASKFGTDVLAAQSIVSTTCVLLYQIPFAISIAISTRVAWYIGAAAKKPAKAATTVAIYISLLLGLINGSFLFCFRDTLASLYTDDSHVIKLTSKVLVVASVYQINDFLSCSTGGILRGQGRQKIGGILNLISYYCIALPCAFTFAFYFKLELVGLWLGMIIALFFVSTLQYYFVLTSDWDYIISECISESVFDDGFNADVHSMVPSMSSSRFA
ncbi:uncharacterized protein AC631_03515 [Debaryomyces fabryi]|uniref:MATE efflux family protein n=1 Tax=Debaryomyces fabryi TaxID=58627 RepID=A0A0V1PWT5_9ASCO|nr:uncharacterized protein AC631_03515 [Debaryomyces fabryi]KSA00745.1 hypothetical protein AC631_03515 [Debaryomyces fabryi]CUM47130.1 unnamed protein product [Debaryomyces fabryi]